MFDLGRTFLAAVERSPDATAITDGERRLGYACWYQEISRLAGGLSALSACGAATVSLSSCRTGSKWPACIGHASSLASADSGGSRPRIRDDVAQHSDLISLGVPR
jgi:hypothetical protein